MIFYLIQKLKKIVYYKIDYLVTQMKYHGYKNKTKKYS